MFPVFGPQLRQYLIVITVNLSVIASGLSIVWSSPVLVKLRNETQTVLPALVTEEQGSWIVSIGFLTGIGGFFLSAFLVDRIGRKNTIFLACVPRIATGFMVLYAQEVWVILLARALEGIFNAVVFIVLPMYASEIANKEIRGSLGTILQVMCSIGAVIMYSVGPFVSYFNLNVIYIFIFVITTLPLVFLPDNPYFLFSKGKTEEAIKVLTFLRGSEQIAHEELKEYAAANSDVQVSKREIFRNRTFWKSFGIVMVMGVGAQLTGFNSVTFYLQSIFESTHTTITPEMSSVIIGMIQLLASFCTMMVTDRFGRKPILAVTLIGLATGMGGLGAFFFVKSTGSISGVMNYMPLVSLILVVYCFSGGISSLSWVISAELFDDRSRGVGLSITTSSSFIFTFVVSKIYPVLLLSIGPAATYWFFSVNCVLLCLFIMFCVPETKGKTFGEIQVTLGAKFIANGDRIEEF